MPRTPWKETSILHPSENKSKFSLKNQNKTCKKDSLLLIDYVKKNNKKMTEGYQVISSCMKQIRQPLLVLISRLISTDMLKKINKGH